MRPGCIEKAIVRIFKTYKKNYQEELFFFKIIRKSKINQVVKG
jgi:hypothetical protein